MAFFAGDIRMSLKRGPSVFVCLVMICSFVSEKDWLHNIPSYFERNYFSALNTRFVTAS